MTIDLTVSFSHVHLYVDHVDDVEVYKEFEESLNGSNKENSHPALNGTTSKDDDDDDSFISQNRDIVRQLMAGLGFRITAVRNSSTSTTNTKSLLITSCDPCGVQFVISAVDPQPNFPSDEYHHFDAANIQLFLEAHYGRQGIAVLGFAVNSVDELHARYQEYHPKLVLKKSEYDATKTNGGGSTKIKVLEVYAYYQGDTPDSEVDIGTVLRFVENNAVSSELPCLLPGLSAVPAKFDSNSQPAYCDHWVSNVHSRIGFLQTLEDVLGFTPKVDFNAGVVAAGEAQIESTVTGNTSTMRTDDPAKALRDQSQVYLPINNALSSVGHVHGFLEEIGQGVQHIASRVENLVEFVQRANDNRKRTGEGFTFLRIPRSYYGVLTMQDFFVTATVEVAQALIEACELHKIVALDGAVDLTLTDEMIEERMDKAMKGSPYLDQYEQSKVDIIHIITNSRYKNLLPLLKDNISDETYLSIVRNQVLVDVQGEDLLYQIFTNNILQRESSEEAPFLEFIQRVCSESSNDDACPKKVKPGCGGFGIRNFLTLFLSIEVSKAMTEVTEAKLAGDEKLQTYAQAKVDCFTNQLNESNPILTDISNAMTEEGECKEQWMHYSQIGDEIEALKCKERMEAASQKKAEGNFRLLAVSTKYMNLMRSFREEFDLEEPICIDTTEMFPPIVMADC